MVAAIGCADVFLAHMGIDLGRTDIGVPEQDLDGP
jgi:hypothetical protein